MTLIIDGYNLLNATGIFAPGAGPNTLERSRQALLDFIADKVDPADARRTTVVFDAKLSPPGLQRTTVHRGLTVKFAAKHQEADDLIEELIRADSAPRQLTVVSSDHRLQRAARRRRAVAIDSDAWFRQIATAARERQSADVRPAGPKPQEPPTAAEVAAWMQWFGDIDVHALQPAANGRSAKRRGCNSCVGGHAAATPAEDVAESFEQRAAGRDPKRKPKDSDDVDAVEDLADPFPPGYGEDLLREEG